MTNTKAVIDKEEWLMIGTHFDNMVARASFENIPVPIKVEKTEQKATIYLHGPIVKTHDVYSIIEGGVSVEDFENAVAESQLSREIELDIDCGGGQALAAIPMCNAIKRSTVPVRVRVSGVCASLAYMIACATGSPIVAAGKGTVIGSVGAMGVFDPERDTRVVRSENAQNKNSLADVQQRLNSWEKMFYEVVSEGRGVSEQLIKETYGNGMAFVAEEALARRMIDSIDEAAPSAAPATTQTQESQLMSEIKDGVMTMSTDEYEAKLEQERELAREKAKAEFIADQEKAELKAKQEKEEAENLALIRRTKIENYAKENKKEHAAAVFLDGKEGNERYAKMDAETAIASLALAPVDEQESAFQRGARDPANNPDVGAGTVSSIDGNDDEMSDEDKDFVSYMVANGKTREEAMSVLSNVQDRDSRLGKASLDVLAFQ